jgi:hypothetical protein
MRSKNFWNIQNIAKQAAKKENERDTSEKSVKNYRKKSEK